LGFFNATTWSLSHYFPALKTEIALLSDDLLQDVFVVSSGMLEVTRRSISTTAPFFPGLLDGYQKSPAHAHVGFHPS